MLPSETLALKFARRKGQRNSEKIENVLIVIAPYRAATDLAPAESITQLCHIGEFMVNDRIPIDRVTVILPPISTGDAGTVIDPEFGRYMRLWVEQNQRSITVTKCDAGWIQPPPGARCFVGGLRSPSRNDSFGAVCEHLKKHQIYAVDTSPNGYFAKDPRLKSAWDLPELEDFTALFSDRNYSPERFDGWWTKTVSDGTAGHRAAEPLFMSNTGVFFGYGCATHPLHSQVPPSYLPALTLPNKLRHAGPNPSVCIVPFDDKTSVFKGRPQVELEVERDDRVGTITALIRLLGEIVHDPSIEVEVLYRGLHPDHSSARIHSWRELVIFGVRGLTGAATEPSAILQSLWPPAQISTPQLPQPVQAEIEEPAPPKRPLISVITLPEWLYNYVGERMYFDHVNHVTAAHMEQVILAHSAPLKLCDHFEQALSFIETIKEAESMGVRFRWAMVKKQ